MAVAAGAGVWALLRFGVPIWLTDKEHPARPVLEALSWIAGIGGLVVAVGALVVARRQGQPADHAGASAPSAPSPSMSQTATDGSAIVHGNVTGGAGGGPAVGVNFGQVGGPPDPTGPTRGEARPRRASEGPDRPGSPEA